MVNQAKYCREELYPKPAQAAANTQGFWIFGPPAESPTTHNLMPLTFCYVWGCIMYILIIQQNRIKFVIHKSIMS